MKRLQDSKIMNISHNDMDGVGASIALGNSVPSKNIKYWYATYKDIDDIVRRLNFNSYDYVIMTDISPHDHSLIKDKDNLILLDHHDTAKDLHNPSEFRAVIEGKCASLITKEFCELTIGADISYLDELFTLINDYDMWIHNDKRSKQLNELYYMYWGEKFRKRFFEGNVEFTDTEKEYLQEREKELKILIDNLEYYPLESINGALFSGDQRINDVCDFLITKEKYDIVFCKVAEKGKICVRSKIDNIHIGNILREYMPSSGGGHKDAGSIDLPKDDIKLIQKTVNDLVEIIKERKLNVIS